MLRVLDARLRCDWSGAGVVISGSLPPGLTPEFYRTMTEVARAAGSKVFIDTSGDALRDSLSARPEVAKPNRSEAEVLLGAKIGNVEQAIAGAKKMLGLGAGSVAITLGAEGLVWLPNAADLSWIAKPPKLKPISTVGCGDATMAGIAYSALSDMDAEDAVRLAAACGAAMCVTELGAQISEKDVQSMLSRIEVRSVVP
jgi:1-phosphofructokinase family hexose kinase